MSFREKIRNKTYDFNIVQMQTLAWRCAIRVLPFLGASGNFKFWEEKDRQKNLFVVFTAIDITSTLISASTDKAYRLKFQIIVDNIYAAAISAADATASTSTSAIASLNSVIYSSSKDTSTILDVITSAITDVAYNAAEFEIDLKEQVIEDIDSILSKQKPSIDTVSYGAIWDRFIRSLKRERCQYWVDWYTFIFKNNFDFDLNEVNQRIGLPNEIKDKGASVVGNFIIRLKTEGGGERLNEARILVLGDKGAGKTCVARKLVNTDAAMTEAEDSTSGVDTFLWRVPETSMNIRIWDFAGHTITHAVHQFFLSERCLYLLVYNGRTEETWRLEYWLNHMKNYGGDSRAIILVNVWDRHYNEIPINRLKEQYAVEEVYYVNIKKQKKKFKEFRKSVANYISNNPSWERQKIPNSYYQVKETLEARFTLRTSGVMEEHIKRDAFDKIAKEYSIDNPELLLEDLHALGICLWYESMEQYNTLILNPEWISDGVYKIINWVNNKKTHTILLRDFAKVFVDDKQRYPEDQYEFLYNLVLHYELAYETELGNQLIIPHLLQEDQPKELPVFEINDSLMLLYKANQPLLPNTISRFIVKHNEQIKKQDKDYLVWRYGVILEDGNGNIALVREWDRTIDVSVKGSTKTEFISILRETLNEIFEGYKSEKPELQYNITRFGDENYVGRLSQLAVRFKNENQKWLPEHTILSHLNRGRDYYDPISDRDISIKTILDQFGIPHTTTVNLINNPQTVITGGEVGKIETNTFNFKDCTISIEGSLRELARHFNKDGDDGDAEDLIDAAEVLDEIDEKEGAEVVKKKGLLNGLKRVVEDLGDEESSLYKRVDGVRKSVRIAQDIAAKYNDIAQWVGWPQVPKPFLKKD